MTQPTITDRACAGTDHDLWFDSYRQFSARRLRMLRALCASCPFLAECKASIMAKPADYLSHSFVAGMTPQERLAARGVVRVRDIRPPIPHGTPSGSRAHRRQGEPLCEPCRLAHNAATAEAKRIRRAEEARRAEVAA
jgi:hypothetical protein